MNCEKYALSEVKKWWNSLQNIEKGHSDRPAGYSHSAYYLGIYAIHIRSLTYIRNLLWVKYTSILFKYKLNNKGPRSGPWGTPDIAMENIVSIEDSNTFIVQER